jgi:hypothetical protein
MIAGREFRMLFVGVRRFLPTQGLGRILEAPGREALAVNGVLL